MMPMVYQSPAHLFFPFFSQRTLLIPSDWAHITFGGIDTNQPALISLGVSWCFAEIPKFRTCRPLRLQTGTLDDSESREDQHKIYGLWSSVNVFYIYDYNWLVITIDNYWQFLIAIYSYWLLIVIDPLFNLLINTMDIYILWIIVGVTWFNHSMSSIHIW